MRKFGLIGKSLDHSRSKDYFERKFIKENIRHCVYENFPLGDLSGLRDMIFHDRALCGLNITNPYKIEVLNYLDDLDPVSKAIGAVNCLKISRNGDSMHVKGFNTDSLAFRDTLRHHLDDTCRKALILGTGGAARAVSYALQELNIEYSFVSREKKEGILTYSALDESIIKDHQVIINATPAGMFPDSGHCPPLPYSYLTSYHLLYDLVYNPEITLFLKKGRESGARIKNGLEMLQVQAELSWSVWN
jgi:shikimate dehydrogenase